jgi:hypothetical protein
MLVESIDICAACKATEHPVSGSTTALGRKRAGEP